MSDNFIHTEAAFESAIVDHLCKHGWEQGSANDFSRDLAFDENAILTFIQSSQSKEWEKLKQYTKRKQKANLFSGCSKNLTCEEC